jgi:hypothetical protein
MFGEEDSEDNNGVEHVILTPAPTRARASAARAINGALHGITPPAASSRRVRNTPHDMSAWLLERTGDSSIDERALFHLPDGAAKPGLHFSGAGLIARRDYLYGVLDSALTGAAAARVA